MIFIITEDKTFVRVISLLKGEVAELIKLGGSTRRHLDRIEEEPVSNIAIPTFECSCSLSQ